MAYQVLARKYRPLRFADVVGQDHVTRTLLNALAGDRIAHGYIFSGHRGIGKTTIARILASALNCQNTIGSEARPTPEPCLVCNSCTEIRAGNAVDVLEIDAATNRGIDEIRELRDAARYSPARDRFKIILLDEAHQITDAAFNALLKTLEEPPAHIVFMMATTQPEDIPQTIRSRCQHFSFHAVKLDDIVGQLRKISLDEHIDVDDATLGLLAEAGDGSMRDALSIMDQAIASAPPIETPTGARPHVQLAEVRELMGAVSNVVFEEILTAVHANDSAAVLHTLGTLLDAGNGPQAIARQFVRFLRNCVVAKITDLHPEADATGLAAELLQISAEERRRAARAAQNFSEEELSRFLSILLRTFDDLGYRGEQRLHLELGLLKLVHAQRLVPIEEILTQLGVAPAPLSASPATAAPAISARAPAIPTPATPNPATPNPTTPNPTTPNPGAPFFAASSQRAGSGAPKTPKDNPPISPNPTISPISPNPTNPTISTNPTQTPPLPPEQLSTSAATPSLSADHPALDLSILQAAAVASLASTKGQTSAAEALENSVWTTDDTSLTIQTTVSRITLPVLINAEAERLLRATLRDGNAGHLHLKLLPGVPATQKNEKPRSTRPAAAGTAAELAENHPVVQQAKRLFSAEISNVIDLRKN